MQQSDQDRLKVFDDPTWQLPVLAPLKKMAHDQLGTVGGGNHYVDIFADEEDRIWVGVHFGSRGLGHKTATAFLQAAGGRDGMDVPPALLDVGAPTGQDYLAATQLAGRYAYAGREYVCRLVARQILGAGILEEVHNHHNFVWRESHGDEELWVREKGVCLRGGGCDEAPQAYRRLVDVLQHHRDTIRVLHELRPIGVAMAGEDVYDPFKD